LGEIVDENEELQERYEELIEDNDNLELKIEELEEKVNLLTEENRRLRQENFAIGNLIDFVIVERGIDVFEGSSLKP
jgi:predicted nuclease with TOPRIM domain